MKPTITIFGIIISLILNSQMLNAQPKLYLLSVKTTSDIFSEFRSDEETKIFQKKMDSESELTVWITDINGGALERGDTIFLCNYSDSFNVNSTRHQVQIWDPLTCWQYTIALFDAGEKVFDGTKLNLKSNDVFSLILVDLDPQTAENQSLISIGNRSYQKKLETVANPQ